jgi:hypothetical protein
MFVVHSTLHIDEAATREEIMIAKSVQMFFTVLTDRLKLTRNIDFTGFQKRRGGGGKFERNL